MKKTLIYITLILMCSCVNEFDRIEDCKKKYPNSIVTPSTSLIKSQGYDITAEDTITNQIYAIRYYPFSSSKILDITNIR